MHKIQQNLLKLALDHNLGNMTLREIGALIGERYPQKIKHHLSQLEKKGLITMSKTKGLIERTKPGKVRDAASLLSIPILGTANCGPATFYADSNHEGYLKVSSSLLRKKKYVYAIKASGLSMNKAQVDGNAIRDGDYLIIDSTDTSPRDGDIIVSVFDNVANVKKFYFDKDNNRIVLTSDSTRDFPPIFIHEDDDFRIAGKVIQVLKKPSM